LSFTSITRGERDINAHEFHWRDILQSHHKGKVRFIEVFPLSADKFRSTAEQEYPFILKIIEALKK